jgi:hypothetical protein
VTVSALGFIEPPPAKTKKTKTKVKKSVAPRS